MAPCVWDLDTCQELFRFEGHPEMAHCVDWSPDGKHIASSSYDKSICIWRVPTPKERQEPRLWHKKGELRIASADPRAQVRIKQGGKVVKASHQRSHTLQAGTDEVALVGEPGNLHVSPRRVEVGKLQYPLAPSSSPPQALVRIWRGVKRGPQHRLSLKGHTELVRGVDISPDGKQALTASWDRTVRLWDLKTGQEIRRLQPITERMNRAIFSPDGKTALTAGHHRMVRIWDLKTGREIRGFQGHTDGIWHIALSRNGKRAVSCGGNGTIRVWDLASGKQLHLLRDSGGVEVATFSPDDKWIVSGGAGGITKVWDAEKGVLVRRLNDRKERVFAALFTPKGDQVITAGVHGPVRVWDFQTGKSVREMHGHEGPIICADLSPDGTQIVSAGRDGTVRLWELSTGKELYRFRGHAEGTNAVTFSSDGKFILSGGGAVKDFDVNLWEVPKK